MDDLSPKQLDFLSYIYQCNENWLTVTYLSKYKFCIGVDKRFKEYFPKCDSHKMIHLWAISCMICNPQCQIYAPQNCEWYVSQMPLSFTHLNLPFGAGVLCIDLPFVDTIKVGRCFIDAVFVGLKIKDRWYYSVFNNGYEESYQSKLNLVVAKSKYNKRMLNLLKSSLHIVLSTICEVNLVPVLN